MAETRRERVKQSLLLVFIALNVILILFVWADNLIEKPGNQGFVRATAIPSTTLSVTTTESQKTPTPSPDTRQTPGDPTGTTVPFKDSGDIGMLKPSPNPRLSG